MPRIFIPTPSTHKNPLAKKPELKPFEMGGGLERAKDFQSYWAFHYQVANSSVTIWSANQHWSHQCLAAYMKFTCSLGLVLCRRDVHITETTTTLAPCWSSQQRGQRLNGQGDWTTLQLRVKAHWWGNVWEACTVAACAVPVLWNKEDCSLQGFQSDTFPEH